MRRFQDLETMIEILGLAIARQETEEQFFRRSAQASSNEVAYSLFTEIADDLKGSVEKIEQRKQKLLDAVAELSAAKKE